MRQQIRDHFIALVQRSPGADNIQVGLAGFSQAFGPGKVELVSGNLYRIFHPQVIPGPGGQHAILRMPVVFDADDVMLIIEPPVNPEGDKAIVTPGGNGSRTPGGLHIPGRS